GVRLRVVHAGNTASAVVAAVVYDLLRACVVGAEGVRERGHGEPPAQQRVPIGTDLEARVGRLQLLDVGVIDRVPGDLVAGDVQAVQIGEREVRGIADEAA